VDVSGFEEATLRMTLAPGVELPGLVWMSGEPEWVPDIQRSPSLRGSSAARGGLRAGFAFPVRYGSEIRGVIEFFGQRARDPDRDLLAVAPILGRQIGEALERKRAEELLRASEDRFRSVAESATDALVTADGDGLITYINPAAERMLGYHAADLVGKPLSLILPAVTEIGDSLVGQTVERTGRRMDGTELSVELSVARWATEEGVFSSLLMRDVSERKQAEQELRQARDAAEASSRELEAFSYSVSHDLRTPVRSIDGFSQALIEDYGDRLGDEGKDNLLRVRAAAEKMSELIDDLLELSRTGRTALHQQTVDLSAMAREIAQELRASSSERQVEFIIGEGISAWADPRLMRVVLQNLLDNAWKFSANQPQARIQFGSFFDGGQPVYYVQDNGIGFDVAFSERLFIPFQRLHEEEGVPGTGVGLALVQRIIVRHGGRIWAESAVGRGATFYFTLRGDSTRRPE
jgi:PAS domain S-box-containing protein